MDLQEVEMVMESLKVMVMESVKATGRENAMAMVEEKYEVLQQVLPLPAAAASCKWYLQIG